MPVCFDNNVHSYLTLKRDIFSPHCQIYLRTRKLKFHPQPTQACPHYPTPQCQQGHSPPTKKASVVTDRSQFTHITTHFSYEHISKQSFCPSFTISCCYSKDHPNTEPNLFLFPDQVQLKLKKRLCSN